MYAEGRVVGKSEQRNMNYLRKKTPNRRHVGRIKADSGLV